MAVVWVLLIALVVAAVVRALLPTSWTRGTAPTVALALAGALLGLVVSMAAGLIEDAEDEQALAVMALGSLLMVGFYCVCCSHARGRRNPDPA